LGIGGEWAAGAAMVAEVVPEKRRVEAGALLYTSAPLGLFLATYVNYLIAGHIFTGSPETSWRWVFLSGLAPAFVALAVRAFIKEPEKWCAAGGPKIVTRIGELFSPQYRALTISGLSMAIIALITWWSCNALQSVAATLLAQAEGKARGLDKTGMQHLIENWKAIAANSFNLGGLIGTLITVPFAKNLGRKKMFATYFALAAIAIYSTWGVDIPPQTRLYMCFFIGLTVFGVFGSFTYYLPELFPTRVRGTGAGFCYNAGRTVTAIGPILIGILAAKGVNALMQVLSYVAIVPLIGLLLLPVVIETRDKPLDG